MSAITAPNLAPTAPTAPTSPVAPVINPPPSVSALEPGTIVQGTVTGRDKQGLLLVKTDVGNILIQTPQQIPQGAKLQLEIQVQGSQLQVVILSTERPPGADAAAAAQLLAQTPALALADDSAAVSTRGLGANLAQALADKGLPPGVSANLGAANLGAAGLGAAIAAGLLAADGAAALPTSLAAGTVATALLAQAGEALAGAVPRNLPSAYGSSQLAAQVSSQAAIGLASAVIAQTAEAVAPTPFAQAPTVATQARSDQIAQNQAAQGQVVQSQIAQGQIAQARAQVTPAAVLLAAQGAPVPAPGPAAPGPTSPNAAGGALQTGAPILPGAAPAATVASQIVQGVQAAVAGVAPHGPQASPAGAQPGATPTNWSALAAPPGGSAPSPAGAQPTALTNPATSILSTDKPAPVSATASTATPSGAAPAATTIGATKPGTASAATQPAAALAMPALPASGALTVRVLAVASPGPGGVPTIPQNVVAPSGTVPVLTGTVLFTAPQGQPVVQTSAGVLTLNVRADLPIGSAVTLEILGEAPAAGAPPAQTASTGAPAPLVSLSRQWPTLDETFEALRQVDPQLAQSVQRAILPQPGPHLGSGMLFFMSALKGGDVRAWIGEPAVRALEGAGKGRLLAKLNDEFKELGRGGEVSEGEWRGFFMPVHDGQQIQQIRLFVHHNGGDGKGEGDDAEGTRFMLDVELSRMGPVQIDGLVRDKRLDLVVRTRAALPEEMRHDINRIFASAGETTGFRGVLTFQAGPKMPPPPLEQVVGHRPDVVV